LFSILPPDGFIFDVLNDILNDPYSPVKDLGIRKANLILFCSFCFSINCLSFCQQIRLLKEIAFKMIKKIYPATSSFNFSQDKFLILVPLFSKCLD